MLGTYMTEHLDAIGLNRKHFDARSGIYRLHMKLIRMKLSESDVVINCVGILKPYIEQIGTADTIKINSVFPQEVSDLCKAAGAKFIHICSDCVFSGQKGQYVETDICDASDLYAKTKSIEPTDATIIPYNAKKILTNKRPSLSKTLWRPENIIHVLSSKT